MSKKDEQPTWHKNGVRKGEESLITLPSTVGLERNLLGVPIFVLHAKAARSLTQLIYSWPLKEGGKNATFTFSRTGDNPFPQSQHAMYLDILLALFAVNFREDGVLHFRISDVLRAAGKDPRSQGAKEAVVEAIRRYRLCHMNWNFAWMGRNEAWSGSIIQHSNLWDEDDKGHLNPRNGRSNRNPRNNHDKEKWHTVRFHPYIVESIRDGHTRIILASVMGSGLKHDAFCVYRYFYGFSDRSEVKRTIQHLLTAFPWTGREKRFVIWLKNQLEELLRRDLITYYSIKGDWVTVKCKPIEDLERKSQAQLGSTDIVDNVPKDLKSVNAVQSKQGENTAKRRRTTIKNLTDEALLSEYFTRRSSGAVSLDKQDLLDLLINKGAKDLYIPALRNYLEK